MALLMLEWSYATAAGISAIDRQAGPKDGVCKVFPYSNAREKTYDSKFEFAAFA